MAEHKKQTTAQQSRAERYLKRADKCEEVGDIRAAITLLEKAPDLGTDNVGIYMRLAELYRLENMPDHAVVAIRRVIEIEPDDVQARETLTEILLEQGRYDDVIEESREILRHSRNSLAARDMLSIAYLQKGMMDKALQVTNELIRLDPTSPLNHFKKAVLYQQKGDIGSAIHEFSRVLDMQPDEDLAEDAEQAIESLDSYQLRNIIMLAVEDYIFRTKLIRDPEMAAIERGYYLSEAGMATLKQIQFDELPEVYDEWKQRYYH